MSDDLENTEESVDETTPDQPDAALSDDDAGSDVEGDGYDIADDGEPVPVAPEDEVAAITASLEEPVAEDGAPLVPAEPVADHGEPPAPAEPAVMDLGPERRTAWWVWLLGVLGVIAVGAAGWALWYYFLSPVTVPRVIGKDIGRAAQVLNDSDVRLGRTSEVPTSSAPPGTVIEQTPEEGTEVERNIEVSLVIAAPPTTSAVPDVKGQTLEDAQRTLAREELGSTIVETYDSAIAPGAIISQLPTSGVELPPGSLVALAVSKGPSPSTATVPDLRGIGSEDAQKIIASLDLVAAAYRSNDASVPAGQIATQSPAPGTRVPARSTVMFLVSDGRALSPVTVPNVVNSQSKTASAKIKAAGLVAKSRKVTHPSVPSGDVVAQMPPSGQKVAKGSTVGLLVSRGPSELLPVPSVVATGQAEASKAIAAAGFRPVMLPVPTAEGTPGQVIAQWPSAKTSWTQLFPVIAIYRQ